MAGFAKQAFGAGIGDTEVFVESLTASGKADLSSTGCTIFTVDIDCTNNTTEDIYVELRDQTTYTAGEEAELCLLGRAGTVTSYICHEGTVFDAGLSIGAVTAIGGSTGPTGTVNVRLTISD